jgi:hypothetical protein
MGGGGVTLSEDMARREANRINNEQLQEWRQRYVEVDEELACSLFTSAERLLYDSMASVSQDVQHPPRISLKERKKRLVYAPLAPFEFPQFFPSLILQYLSWGSTNTLVLQVELTQSWEAENSTVLESCRCFMHRQDIGWSRSRVPVLRWSSEL